MSRFRFPSAPVTDTERKLRADVRNFLSMEREAGAFIPAADCWVSAPSPEFSRKLGNRGWLGMTWPARYGGHEQSALHRLAVTEELLAAGAPVSAHWIADRQSGAQILRYGTETQKKSILPRVARGDCFFAIGMSEPQAGSDLAAVLTNAVRTADGWRLNGTKIWSTGANYSHYMIVLARTSAAEARNRRIGLSQFLVDLSLPGIHINGIRDLAGSAHFNETFFADVELPTDAMLGQEGQGWSQCMGELAVERSGPERFLTTFLVLDQALTGLAQRLDMQGRVVAGRLIAHLRTLRHMSRGVAILLEDGSSPETEAALVKELGTRLEQDILCDMRKLLSFLPTDEWPTGLPTLLVDATLRLPSNTLRGGTSEILRGIVARQLGLR